MRMWIFMKIVILGLNVIVAAYNQCQLLSPENECFQFISKTKLPNYFNSTDLQNASKDMSSMLVSPMFVNNTCNSTSHAHMMILSCLLSYPICSQGIRLLPCRSFCDDVVSNCSINDINGLDASSLCNSLPEYPDQCFPIGYSVRNVTGVCEPVREPLCEIFGFHITSYPNWVKDANQNEALQSIARLTEEKIRRTKWKSTSSQVTVPGTNTIQPGTPGPLVPPKGQLPVTQPQNHSQPSVMNIASFMCSLFFPKCNIDGSIEPPCRSFCRDMSEKLNITSITSNVSDIRSICNSFPDKEGECTIPPGLTKGICPKWRRNGNLCTNECFVDWQCAKGRKCCIDDSNMCLRCLKPVVSDGSVSDKTLSIILDASVKFTRAIPLQPKKTRRNSLRLDTQRNIQRFISKLPRNLAALFHTLETGNKTQVEKFDEKDMLLILKRIDALTAQTQQVFLTLDNNTVSNVSLKDLQSEILELVVVFKPNIIHNISAGLTDDQLQDLCPWLLTNKRLNRRYMEYISANIPKCNVFIMQQTQKMGGKLSLEQASVVMDNIRSVSPPDTWTLDVLKTAPKAINVDDIQRMNVSLFSNTTSLRSVIGKLSRKVKKEAVKKIKEARGKTRARDWDTQMFETMATMFPEDLKTKDIRDVPTEIVVKSLKSIPKEVVRNSKLSTNIQRKIILHMTETGKMIESLNQTDLKDMIPFLVQNRKTFKKLTPTQLEQNLNSLKDMPFKKSEKRRILKKLGNAINYTAAGDLVEALRPRELRQIPVSSLIQMVPNLKKMNLTKGQVKAVRKAMGNNFPKVSNITANNIEEYGTLLSAFSGKELDALPENVISQKLSFLSKVDIGKSKFRRLVKKLKQSGNATIGAKFKELGKHAATTVPRKWLEQGNFSELGLENGLTIQTSPAQSSTIFEIVKAELGVPGSENSNYTGSRIQGFGTMGIFGPNLTDISSLVQSGDGIAIASAVMEKEDIIPDVKVKKVVNTLRESLGFSNESNVLVNAFGKDTWTQLSRLLPYFNWTNDYPKIHISDKVHMCDAFQGSGDSEQNKLTADDAKAITDIALLCMEENSLLPNTMLMTSLNETHMDFLPGSLKCGLTKREIQMLDADAIASSLPDLERCPFFDEDIMRTIIDTAKGKIQNVFTDSEYLDSFGSLMTYLTTAELQNVDKEEFVNVLPSVMDKISEKRRKRYIRNKMGVGKAKDETSDPNQNQNMGSFSAFVVDAVTSDPSSVRKKRSTDPLTCDEIESMEPVLSSLSNNTLSSIVDSEFLACLESFGNTSDWSVHQLSLLADKVKRPGVLGPVSAWTEEDMILAGSIIAGLTPNEIGQLQLDSEEIFSSIGKHDLYSSSQLVSGFDRWLSLAKSNQVSNISSEELLALENFVCGISSQKMNYLDADEVIDSLSAFRDCPLCNATQMTVLANKVKVVYGNDVTAWEPALISDIGMIIGGLDKDAISLLDIDQIGELVPNTIEKMPPTTFVGFTPQQLALFSINQLRAVSDAQYNVLDTNQKNALKEIFGSSETGTSDGCCLGQIKVIHHIILLLVFEKLVSL